jgi:hypothetical protein
MITHAIISTRPAGPLFFPFPAQHLNPSNFYGSINLAAEAQADNESSNVGNSKTYGNTRFANSAGFRWNQTRRCSLPLCAAAWKAAMQDEHDAWNTTYFHRAIRKRIGEALLAGYDLSQPLPE